MTGRSLQRLICVLVLICFPYAHAEFAAEALSVGLTKNEQQTVREAQARILREADENLLRHLNAKHDKPYPLDTLVHLVGGKRAAARLAELLGESRFQNMAAHIQILHALERLQAGGAGKQIRSILALGTYEHNPAMLSNAVAAFSPSEVKRYENELAPYLKHENILLRTLVAFRLAVAGVDDGKAELAKLIVAPNRYVEITIMSRLGDCNSQLGNLALKSLPKAEFYEGKRLIAHIVLASGVKDRPKGFQALIEDMKLRPKPMPVTGNRRTRAVAAAIQALLEHETYRAWIVGNGAPLVFSEEDVGADFRLPDRKIRLIRYAHIQILGMQDKCLSVRVHDNVQNSIMVSVGFGPLIKRSTISVNVAEENGKHKVINMEHLPGE